MQQNDEKFGQFCLTVVFLIHTNSVGPVKSRVHPTMPKVIFTRVIDSINFALRFTICEWLCLAAFCCCCSFVYALYIKLILVYLYVLFVSVCLVHTTVQCAGCRHLRLKYIRRENSHVYICIIHICRYTYIANCIDMLVRCLFFGTCTARQTDSYRAQAQHFTHMYDALSCVAPNRI